MSSDGDRFRIALIGDFSARGQRGVAGKTGSALSSRRPIRVDRDDLDAAVASLAPTLTLTLPESTGPVTLRFESLDDFHPDNLFQRLAIFRSLRESGERAAAGASLGTRPAPATPSGVLEAILGDAPLPPGGASLAAPAAPPSLRPETAADAGLAAFVARAVAPHVVRQPDESEVAARARIDASITATMRALLHHPDFQALEALWRGVELLVRRLETDATLQLHLVDVSLAELEADLAGRPADESEIYRLLHREGDARWALLAGAFPLGSDLPLVARFGELARDLGAPMIAEAHPSLAGVTEIGATPDPDDWDRDESADWLSVRQSGGASWLALLFPRFLVRLPYGHSAEPCELFAFEEIAEDEHPRHDELLWGSAAIAGTFCVGQWFGADDRRGPVAGGVISGLPLHIYRTRGEPFAVPVVETVLGESAVLRLYDRGLCPLITVRESDAIRIIGLISIAMPPAPLYGLGNERR